MQKKFRQRHVCESNDGRGVDKSGLFAVFYGELRAAPMIADCPLTMECKVLQTVDLPTNSFFIAEIISMYIEERFVTEGNPDVKKMNPFLLTLPDNNFWSIGECVGKAWNSGKNSKRKLLNRTKEVRVTPEWFAGAEKLKAFRQAGHS